MSQSVNTESFPGGVVTRAQQAELHAMEHSIIAAIDRAKQAGLPQGLIVATLRGHEYQQTKIMVEGL